MAGPANRKDITLRKELTNCLCRFLPVPLVMNFLLNGGQKNEIQRWFLGISGRIRLKSPASIPEPETHRYAVMAVTGLGQCAPAKLEPRSRNRVLGTN